jgi:hypothetical protein
MVKFFHRKPKATTTATTSLYGTSLGTVGSDKENTPPLPTTTVNVPAAQSVNRANEQQIVDNTIEALQKISDFKTDNLGTTYTINQDLLKKSGLRLKDIIDNSNGLIGIGNTLEKGNGFRITNEWKEKCAPTKPTGQAK